jgi:hypothetical protein
MNMLGSVGEFVGKVPLIHFYNLNMRSLFKQYGSNIEWSTCGSASLGERGDVYIEMVDEWPPKKLLKFRREKPKTIIHVYLDKGFIADVEVNEGDLYIKMLWFFLTYHFRLWLSMRNEININELIPARAIYDMPDSYELIELHVDKHQRGILTEHQLFMALDAAFVGLHISRLVTADSSVCQNLQFNDVAEFIILARRGNWQRLIER